MIDRILIFSGTTEGRRLAEVLSEEGISGVVCVATEYGLEVMEELSGITVRQGRLNEAEMASLMGEGFAAVVDATHPFATEVSANIRSAAEAAGLEYLRLRRSTGSAAGEPGGDVRFFDTNEECAAALKETTGRILLATGSKELGIYCSVEGLRDRLVARVLPNDKSIAICREQGLKGADIIAMQGPFSEEMNIAVFRQYDISVMVTKETGTTGGAPQKAAAAAKCGVSLYVIKNPETEPGMSFDQVCSALGRLTGRDISASPRMNIALVGAGMGDMGTMTKEALDRIKCADYIFGAKRLIDGVLGSGGTKAGAKSFPLYRADDIIGVLEDVLSERKASGEYEGDIEAVILFSGDTGFYSGSASALGRLREWSSSRRGVSAWVLPGISSVSYFASRLGMSWEDAALLSVHGRGQRRDWQGEVISSVALNKKTFILVSGPGDVRDIGGLMPEYGLDRCEMFFGSRLSSSEERIAALGPDDLSSFEEEGPIILAVINHEARPYYLTPHLSDAEFIRGGVPMTKEEVRDIVLCKLRLTEGSLVYDIGSGTGSVAVAIAERGGGVRVFAIEREEEGCELIRKNARKHAAAGVEVVCGTAPEAMAPLPAPTHAFIGGSGGELFDILRLLYEKNPAMRVVITSVTMETTSLISEVEGRLPIRNKEIIQLQLSRGKKAGSHTLMRAENPVFICSFDFGKDDEGEGDV